MEHFQLQSAFCPILLTTTTLCSALIPALATCFYSEFVVIFFLLLIIYAHGRAGRWYFSSRTPIWVWIYKDAHWHFDCLLPMIKMASFLNVVVRVREASEVWFFLDIIIRVLGVHSIYPDVLLKRMAKHPLASPGGNRGHHSGFSSEILPSSITHNLHRLNHRQSEPFSACCIFKSDQTW